MKIRINNDIILKWSVFRQQEPEDFSNAISVCLEIIHPYTRIKYSPQYTIAKNVITIQYPAKKQIQTGEYMLLLQYSKPDDTIEGGVSTFTVDYTDAFCLVEKSNQSGSPSEKENLKITTVQISSNIDRDSDGRDGITPSIGANGNWFLGSTDTGKPSHGKDFKYTDFTEDQLLFLRKPASDAAQSANTAISEIRSLESAVSSNENNRIAAENLRSQTEEKRETDFSSFLTTSSEQVKTEIDKVAPVIVLANNAIKATNTATVSANTAISEIRSLESAVSGNENNRIEAENLRLQTEEKRVTDFSSFLTTSSGQVKTEVDKVAPVITSCSKATEDANAAALNATTQADYAQTQGNYAKEQATGIDEKIAGKADIIEGYINSNQISPLTGTAKSFNTNNTNRSTCNYYNYKKGVTYIIVFEPVGGSNKQFLLYGSNKNGDTNLNFRVYLENLAVKINPPVYNGAETVVTYNVVPDMTNICIIQFYANSIRAIVNGRSNIFTFTHEAFPDTDEYGLCPVVPDKCISDVTFFANILKFTEFDFILSDLEINRLYNNGKPDIVGTQDYFLSPVRESVIAKHTDIFAVGASSITEEENCVARIAYVSDANSWINPFKVRKLSALGKRYLIRLIISTDTPIVVGGIGSLAGNNASDYTLITNTVNGNVGDGLELAYEATLRNISGHVAMFTVKAGAVFVIKEFSVMQLNCTGEYIAAGFRDTRLLDTSRLGRNIDITTGKLSFNYTPSVILPERELVFNKTYVAEKRLTVTNIDYENCLITFSKKHEAALLQRFIPVYYNFRQGNNSYRSIPSGLKGGFRVKEIVDEYTICIENIHGGAFSGNKIENLYPTEVDLIRFIFSSEIKGISIPIRKDLIGKNYEIEVFCTAALYPTSIIGNNYSYYAGQQYTAPYADHYFKAVYSYFGSRASLCIEWSYFDLSSRQAVSRVTNMSSQHVLQSAWNFNPPALTDDITIKITKINE